MITVDMEEMATAAASAAAPPPLSPSHASRRWEILRLALRCSSSPSESVPPSRSATNAISRRSGGGFNLIPGTPLRVCSEEDSSLPMASRSNSNDMLVCYKLPCEGDLKLTLIQRIPDNVNLHDFEVTTRFDVDTTGLIRSWPSEDVLAYFCLNHHNMFRSKRVLELGSGYGLAGLVIAAATDASEVVISDGNPQVIDYVRRSINLNSSVFGATKVRSLTLHWDREQAPSMKSSFDLIVASDCTFFERFHGVLARTIKSLMVESETSEAVIFSPRRGSSLDDFLERVMELGLQFELMEYYDSRVWELHQNFTGVDPSWPSYEKDHCYPIMVRIRFRTSS